MCGKFNLKALINPVSISCKVPQRKEMCVQRLLWGVFLLQVSTFKTLFGLTLLWNLRFPCALTLAQAETSVMRYAKDQGGKIVCRRVHITALWKSPWIEAHFQCPGCTNRP